MKRLIFTLVTLFCITLSASAMTYAQAREQALFLTDKMAYELNLTDEQYEAAYEINLDYLMSIDDYDDLYGAYWRQRNLDLSYILLDWQYRAYVDAAYFYRPIYWDGGYWHFGIYARYPHRDFYYFGRPNFVFTYVGGHSWRMNGGRSWYYGRRWDGPHDRGPHPGMRSRWDGGDYGRGYRFSGSRSWGNGPEPQYQGGSQQTVGNRSFGNGNRGGGVSTTPTRSGRSFGNGSPESSTRTTVSRPGTSRFGSRSTSESTPRSTFSPQGSESRSTGSRSFGNHSAGSAPSSSAPSRSFGGSSTRSYSPSAPSGGSFGSRGSSFGGGGGSRSSGGSFGGGHSGGGGGGGHFGRR